MGAAYDIFVDYDSLCDLQNRLDRISQNLVYSVEQMTNSIRSSQDFLSGVQFEKAKETTLSCVKTAKGTIDNIRHARDYLEKLKAILEDYAQCKYEE